MTTPGIDDWLDLMPSSLTVFPFISRDSFGVAQFGPGYPVRCRINSSSKYIRVASGEQIVARGVAWLASVEPIDVRSKISLPDGTSPNILQSNPTDDENGALFIKLYFD